MLHDLVPNQTNSDIFMCSHRLVLLFILWTVNCMAVNYIIWLAFAIVLEFDTPCSQALTLHVRVTLKQDSSCTDYIAM